MNNQLRDDVRQRARFANSEREIGNVIFEALAAREVDWRRVQADEVKQLLVDGVRAYRGSRGDTPLRFVDSGPIYRMPHGSGI